MVANQPPQTTLVIPPLENGDRASIKLTPTTTVKPRPKFGSAKGLIKGFVTSSVAPTAISQSKFLSSNTSKSVAAIALMLPKMKEAR
jgi:hypothetical protein